MRHWFPAPPLAGPPLKTSSCCQRDLSSLSACGLLAGTRRAQPLQVAPREHRPTVGHANDVVDHRGQRLAPAVTTARLLGDHGASPPLPARSVSPGSVRLLVPRLVVRPQAAGRLPVAWH